MEKGIEIEIDHLIFSLKDPLNSFCNQSNIITKGVVLKTQ